MTELPLTEVFLSEFLGTGILILLGTGVVANVLLSRTKGFDAGWLAIAFGWGLAVFAGVFAAWRTGAHINPAITVGMLASGAEFYDAHDAVPVTLATTLVYVLAQVAGAFVGASLAFVAYKKHFDERTEPEGTVGVFATVPQIRSYPWNVVTEVIATWVLVYVVLIAGNTPHELGPLWVAMLVVGIGIGLGGPTGYAINPARDLGPRLAHAVLPIRGKGSSDWRYAWVPVVGPVIGAVLAGLMA